MKCQNSYAYDVYISRYIECVYTIYYNIYPLYTSYTVYSI